MLTVSQIAQGPTLGKWKKWEQCPDLWASAPKALAIGSQE